MLVILICLSSYRFIILIKVVLSFLGKYKILINYEFLMRVELNILDKYRIFFDLIDYVILFWWLKSVELVMEWNRIG